AGGGVPRLDHGARRRAFLGKAERDLARGGNRRGALPDVTATDVRRPELPARGQVQAVKRPFLTTEGRPGNEQPPIDGQHARGGPPLRAGHLRAPADAPRRLLLTGDEAGERNGDEVGAARQAGRQEMPEAPAGPAKAEGRLEVFVVREGGVAR